MWHTVISTVLGFIPGIPGELKEILPVVIRETHELVVELTGEQYKKMPGKDKLQFVVTEVEEALEESLEFMNSWANMTAERRERLIGGIAEWILFIDDLANNRIAPELAISTPREERRLKRRGNRLTKLAKNLRKM